jgi:hypothetical protein
MSVTWAGQSTSVNSNTTSSVGVVGLGTPTGPAGGALTGSYPNPGLNPASIPAPGSTTEVVFNSAGFLAGDPGFTFGPSTDTISVGNVSLRVLEVSPSGLDSIGTGALIISADGGSENVQIDANLTQTGDLQVTGFFSFAPNGEFIQNAVNGRMDFMPSPLAANTFGVYMDFTSFTVGARMGVIRASDGVKNPAGSYIQYETQLAISSNINTVFGNNAEVVMRVTTTGNDTFQIAPSTAAGRSAAVAICNQSHVGVANRSPATEHVDPTLYVYSSDGAQALDYVRMLHNQTDGVIETGAGDLVLKAAGATKIEGTAYGYTLPTETGMFGQMPERGTGATTKWAYPRNPRNGFALQTDCNTVGDYTALQSGSGASTQFGVASTTTRFGISNSTTGSTATGRAGLGSVAVTQVVFGQGFCEFEAAVAVPTLSDATNTFIVRAGWADSQTAAGVDSVEFQYTDAAGTGAAWDCVTRANSVETRTTVGSNLVAFQFYILKITVDAAGTEVNFYLDDVLVATHTTNIPTGTAQATGALVQIRKTVGTTGRTVRSDYIWHWHGLTR